MMLRHRISSQRVIHSWAGHSANPVRSMQKRGLNPREPSDRERLTSEWLGYAESGTEARFWAYEALSDLIEEDPGLAWEIILDLLHRAPTESTFGLAAAGPLEDLVAWHGREVIDLIEPRVHDDAHL